MGYKVIDCDNDKVATRHFSVVDKGHAMGGGMIEKNPFTRLVEKIEPIVYDSYPAGNIGTDLNLAVSDFQVMFHAFPRLGECYLINQQISNRGKAFDVFDGGVLFAEFCFKLFLVKVINAAAKSND